MKKIFTWMSLCLAVCFTACEYDDTDILNKLNEQEERLAALEKWQATANNNITALQQLVNTMDYITSVSPIMQEKDTIGYTINFLKSNPVSIYNGKNGDTPQISIKQDADQVWYWIVDGEWLKDADGNRVPANGREPITPQIMTGKSLAGKDVTTDAEGNKIVSDAIYLSVDGGKTWYRISGEKGDKGDKGDTGDTGATGPQGPSGSSGASGDSFFESVTIEDGYVIFKLKSGQQFEVPLYKGALTFALGGKELTDLTSPIDISSGDLTYTLSGEGEVSVRILEGENWSARVIDEKIDVTGVVGTGAVLEVVLTNNGKVVETYRLMLTKTALKGTGKEDNPYLLSSVSDLLYFAKMVKDGSIYFDYLKMTQDIDLSGIDNWTPIGEGTNNMQFVGTFDGDGHAIKGLKIKSSSELPQGLFGLANGSVIKNLTLENVSVEGNGSVGAIAGWFWYGKVENCHVKNASVEGNGSVGAIAGELFYSEVENCHVKTSVLSTQSGNIGGISSNNFGGTISDCSVVDATIKSDQYSFGGGIVGSLEYLKDASNASITACRFSGTIEAGRVGGIAGTVTCDDGSPYTGKIEACYASGSLSSNYKYGYVGGVAGSLSGEIVACYFVGEIAGEVPVKGGVVGRQVTSSYGDVPVDSKVNACCWRAGGATHGIGQKGYVNGSESDPASDEGTTQITDNWGTALSEMNNALTGASYRYILNEGSDKETFPLLIEKVQ